MSLRTVFVINRVSQYKELLKYFKDRPLNTHLPSMGLDTVAVDYVTDEELKLFSKKGYDYLTWTYEEIDADIEAHVPEGLKEGSDLVYPFPEKKGSEFFSYSKQKEIRENIWMLKAILPKEDITNIIGEKTLEEATDFEIEKMLLFSEVSFYIPKSFKFNTGWPQDKVKYPAFILSSNKGKWALYEAKKVDVLTSVIHFRLKDLEEAVEKCISFPEEEPKVEIDIEDKIPARTELTVISADRPWNRAIGFKCYEIASFMFNNKDYISNGNIYSISYWGGTSGIITKKAFDVLEVNR